MVTTVAIQSSILYKYMCKCKYSHLTCYSPLSPAPDDITLQVSAVTTTSITVIPSGPSGDVFYEETGSSDGLDTVSYSTSITISSLKPNTWYTITYTVQNNYGAKMTNITKLTIAKGKYYYVSNQWYLQYLHIYETGCFHKVTIYKT